MSMALSNHPRWIELLVGPLKMWFDPSSAFLRYLSASCETDLAGKDAFRPNEREIVRGIYGAVRDRNWGTVRPAISDLSIGRGEGEFRLSFTATCLESPIDFVWRGEITGNEIGEIVYTFDGVANSDFYRNRIGLCVLHPAQLVGQPCTVETVDGSRLEVSFPRSIAPHQPFKGLRRMSHGVADSAFTVNLSFEGDVFETEDQRNWSDDSFKTYSTPLDQPFPVLVEKGTTVWQQVTVKLTESSTSGFRFAPAQYRSAHAHSACSVGHDAFILSPLGLSVASHGQRLSPREQERLRALALDHLRVDVRFDEPRWRQQLTQAAEEARQLNASLHVASHFSHGAAAELEQLTSTVAAIDAPVSRWLLFERGTACTPDNLLRLAAPGLRRLRPQSGVARGTDAYFAELNRQRPTVGLADYLAFSLNPQVHAFDDASLFETLATQPTMVQCCKQFAGEAAVMVSPITLRPRWNPAATADIAPSECGQLPPRVDTRQASLIASAWTLGSIASLMAHGVSSLTYFETTGWLGVMETENGSPMPELFPSQPADVFPVYHVLADLAELRGRKLNPIVAPSAALAGLGSDDAATLLIANLGPSTTTVSLPASEKTRLIRYLDLSTLAAATALPENFRSVAGHEAVRNNTIELAPYAYARVCEIED